MTTVKGMGKRFLLAGLGAALIAATAGVGVLQADDGPRVGIWMDRDDGSVYRPGESVKIHVRPYEDCYVMIYEIDTDGYLKVLFPQDCRDDGYLESGRTYLLGGGHRKFYVSGPEGVDYIHVLASYEPFRRVYWDGCDGYENYAREVSWSGFHDYWGAALPPRIYGDPYVAMETIDEFICQDALEAGLVFADFTYFYVGGHVDYPRYLCYDCHGFGASVRPYADVCLGFSISFVDCDPGWHPWSWWWWASPGRVYCGPRFVCHANEHYWSSRHGHGGHDGCDGHDGHDGHDGWCDKDGRTYPSEYKWKSRHESANYTPPSGQVVERVRTDARPPSEDRSARGSSRGGNIVDATRYKSAERDVDVTRESGERTVRTDARTEVRAEVKTRDFRADAETRDVRVDSRSRVREDRRDDGRDNKREEVKASDSRGERTKSKSGASYIRSALSSISRSITRSGSSSADDTPKGKAPQVRQQGDKGKSQVTRRNVSR